MPISFTSRQNRLIQSMQAEGLDAIMLNPGPSLVYLTGLQFHLMERPVVAIFTPHTEPMLIMPELERPKVEGLPYPLGVFTYGDNPAAWASAFEQAVHAARLENALIGVEPRQLRVLELRFVEAAAGGARFQSAEGCLSALRVCKDAEEIAAMRAAVDIAQRALQATLPAVKVGMCEKEIAAELTIQLLRAGSQTEMPFAPIVSAGPNSANPHAAPSERPLTAGDVLVIDWGAAYEGYVSDLTRTFAVGTVEAELAHIAEIVAAANAAGRAAARPGVPAGEVDRAARQVIEAAGYGPYFTHRTGHGIGLEGHEGPYIFAENGLILQAGMAFTVEPGIYLPGRGGVRIEDNLVITTTGAECLSSLPRHLLTLAA